MLEVLIDFLVIFVLVCVFYLFVINRNMFLAFLPSKMYIIIKIGKAKNKKIALSKFIS